MKLSELKKYIDRHIEFMRADEDPEVVIGIKLPHSTVGGSPFTKVKSVQMGFDWDQAGWADYENLNLKAEIRRLKKLLKIEEKKDE